MALLKLFDLDTVSTSVKDSLDITPYLRSYEVEYKDLDASTERNAKGIAVRDFFRVYK